MRFVALMYTEPERTAVMTADELTEIKTKHAKLREELTASGELRNGCGMAYPPETTTLRWQGATSRGPFHGGREQLSAYYVFDCATEQRAHAIAERLLDWHVTAVEVRSVHDSTGFS